MKNLCRNLRGVTLMQLGSVVGQHACKDVDVAGSLLLGQFISAVSFFSLSKWLELG